MSIPSASTEAYLTYPVVLTSDAWNRTIFLANPARVAEMSQRLASVVQAAWQVLKQQPHTPSIDFEVYQKLSTGRERALVPLTLHIVRNEGEPPFVRIELRINAADPR